jgi:hypothetical protein
MAKAKVGGTSQKVTFGKRKKGNAHKSHNKHDRSERNYRGQGR